MKIPSSIKAGLLLAISSAASAAPIDPGNISLDSGCNSAALADCTVNWGSQQYISDQNAAAVQISRSTGDSWLIRYNLYNPSGSITNGYDEFGNSTVSSSAYSGNVWLEAPTLLAASNLFNVFTDQINGYPDTLPSFYLGMNSTDAIAGHAFNYQSGEPDYTTSGSLSVYNTEPLTCIECSLSIRLELNGLYQADGSLSLVSVLFPEPTIIPLLSLSEYNPYANSGFGSNTAMALYVAPVPLPPALWLMSSSIVGLFAFARRNKKRLT